MTTTPAIRPCHCGSTPAYVHKRHGTIHAMQLRCACGNHGAYLTYREGQFDLTVRVGIDGWNLSEHPVNPPAAAQA